MNPSAGTDIAQWLQTYGPWAIVVICMGAIVVLWRQITTERDKRIEQIERLGKEHKAELTVVLDRLIEATNTQVEKFANLAEQSGRVVDALTRRVKNPRDPGGT